MVISFLKIKILHSAFYRIADADHDTDDCFNTLWSCSASLINGLTAMLVRVVLSLRDIKEFHCLYCSASSPKDASVPTCYFSSLANDM